MSIFDLPTLTKPTFTLSSKGSCLPVGSAALSLFSAVQRELNRFLRMEKKSLLTVDGKLGSNTLAAINMVKGKYPDENVFVQNCSVLATHAASYLATLKNLADRVSAPKVADPKGIVRSSTLPRVDPVTDTVIYPSVTTAGLGGVPYWAIALVGGAAFLYWKKKKK